MDMSAETEAERRPNTKGSSPKLGRLLQDSSLYLIGNVTVRAVGFLAIPFYSRFLSPAQYGLIELVELSTQTVAIAFGLQAIGAALSRLFHDQQTAENEQAVVSTSLIATGILSALVTIVAVIGARPISMMVFHDDTWVRLLQAAFVAMFFSNMIEVVLVYERIRDNAGFFLRYTIITLFLTLGLNVLFIGVLDAGVWGFVSSKLVVTSASCAFLLLRMRRDVGWRWRRIFVPELVRFGAPLVLSSLSYFAIHFSDRFFLSSSVSLAELGRYALAYKFAILVSALVGDSFAKSWNATLYRYVGQANWREQFAHIGAYFSYVLFATGLAIALFSPELLHVMVPPDYFPPPFLLPIIIASYLAREIGDFFRALLLINKRSGLVGNIALSGAVTNVALNIVLIPTYGIYGAAISTFLTWFSYMIVCWIVSNAEHRLPISIAAYVRLAMLVMAIYILGTLTRTSSLPAQILLDASWSIFFCLLAAPVFLSSAEQCGVISFVVSIMSRMIISDGLVSSSGQSAGQTLLLIESPRIHCQDQRLLRHGRLADDLALIGMATVAVNDLQCLPVARFRLHWLIAACKAASREAGIGSVLLTIGPYGLHHLVAAAIKCRIGTPWIADLRPEPHEDQPSPSLIGAAFRSIIQRAVIMNADVLLINEEKDARLLKTRFPDCPLKVQIVASDGSDGGARSRNGEIGSNIQSFAQIIQDFRANQRVREAQHA